MEKLILAKPFILQDGKEITELLLDFGNYSAISSFFRPHPPLRGTLPIGRAVGSLTLTVQPYPPGSLPVEP